MGREMWEKLSPANQCDTYLASSFCLALSGVTTQSKLVAALRLDKLLPYFIPLFFFRKYIFREM